MTEHYRLASCRGKLEKTLGSTAGTLIRPQQDRQAQGEDQQKPDGKGWNLRHGKVQFIAKTGWTMLDNP